MGAEVLVDLGRAGRVEGRAERGFEPLVDAFAANFAHGAELGAGLCVYRRGRPAVELWGGWARPSIRARYGPGTLQLVFSSTKGAVALCVHRLVEQGRLDLHAPVADYWPEFSAAGKATLTVRHLLTHEAGLPTIDRRLHLDDVLAGTPVLEALAAQTPFWEPGTTHGYHPLTFGWLLGELIRRVDGRPVGRYLADEVAGPLGLDFWIGLPAEQEPRVARVRSGRLGRRPAHFDPGALSVYTAMLKPDALAIRSLTLNGAIGSMGGRGPFNSRALHAAELPSVNGITDAPSLARLYAAMLGEVDGMRLLGPKRLEAARVVAVDGPDRVLVVPTRFGEGFQCHGPHQPMLGPGSFGHSGAGGSLGFADVDHQVAFGYVVNQLRFGIGPDERSKRLVEALGRCL